MAIECSIQVSKQLINLKFTIAGFVPALESIWFIGDQFAAKTFGLHFQQNESKVFYTKENFDNLLFTRFNLDLGSNIIGRMRNAFIDALNAKDHLPKMIVMVPDSDIIDGTNHPQSGISLILGKILDYLVEEMNRLISARREQLLKKCKKYGQPHIIWIQPPKHVNMRDNENRHKFNECIESLLPHYKDVSYLKLKDRWDYKREQLYMNGKFTAEGLSSYWESIDSAIKYWETKVAGKNKNQTRIDFQSNQRYPHQNRNQNVGQVSHSRQQYNQRNQEFQDFNNNEENYKAQYNQNRYKWRSDDYKSRNRQFRLPPPPPRSRSYHHQEY